MYNWLKKHRNQKGFTLIELMIVIAIIGILAAIAIPQFASYRAKSYNTASVSDIRNLRTDLEAYYAEWDSYP
ncbi:MAG: prepilin-type N-terminal cleavage/methylation domain-containing protein [Deltaproteobacteria bacterium]|jgi:type IV pilus assembly protein PilA|nr:prepilin-type N-terminal cleavage/methylation domain-containing protein [Deltaproteobacteria bacterium]